MKSLSTILLLCLAATANAQYQAGFSQPTFYPVGIGTNTITSNQLPSNLVYTNGTGQDLFQPFTFRADQTIQSGNFLVFGTVGDIWGNPNHSIEQELQVDSQGSLSFTVGLGATKKAVIQMGGTGAYDAPFLLQTDTTTNLLGYSIPAIFGWKAGTNAANLTNHYMGISVKATSTNTGEAKMQFYSHWAGGDTGFIGAQVDPIGNQIAGFADSTNFTWGGFVASNQLVGTTALVSNIFVGTGSNGIVMGNAGNTNIYIGQRGSNTLTIYYAGQPMIELGAINSGSGTLRNTAGATQIDWVNRSLSGGAWGTTAGFGAGTLLTAVTTITAGSNITAGTGAGLVTINSNQFPIATTGWTNTNTFNCVASVGATAATITYSDGTNTIRTFTAITQELQLLMHPSYKITAASGLTGTAVAQ